MQRYPAASCGGGVSSNTVGGASARDAARADSSFSSSNFSLNFRRTAQLAPYKLKCDKEPLSGRLGPPDFYPQTPNCPEETLTREYLQSGYKETVEGIEEAREIQLTTVGNFIKSEFILKCKEALRKRLRAINESRVQKRKAGQVYGVPLAGSLLVKPGVFPDQRACSEDSRRKWLEGLSQQHKRLRFLADHVPHGYRRKFLFEVLVRHNVPLLRATWFIKVTYLNQVRPGLTNASSATPDKSQSTRTDLWTKDFIEYLQQVLDDFLSKDCSFPTIPSRDHASQTFLPSAAQQKSDSSFSIPDIEEPSLQFKWFYSVRLLQWHHAEGLLLPSLVIEWALSQLQEKVSAEVLELLLPIIYVFIESIAFSQTYVRMFVDIAVQSINDLSMGDLSSAENSMRASIVSALTEMLHYLILVVPDTFVSLDCFPLPVCVVPNVFSRSTSLKVSEHLDNAHVETQDSHHRYLTFGYVASSLQKRAGNLAMIVNHSLQGHGVAKVVQALDKALIEGDVNFAYSALFEDFSDSVMDEAWIAEVSPHLKSSLKWIGTVSSTLVFSIFFLCEWATCDYRDFRMSQPQNMKFTGREDFCQVYLAVLLLKLRKEHLHNSSNFKNGPPPLVAGANGKLQTFQEDFSGGTTVENASMPGNNSYILDNKKNKGDLFESPGPLHDIVVCWLDQHEVGKGEGFEQLQILIMELIRHGIFFPQSYVRQLIVSGIMDMNVTPLDLNRQIRHRRILKQLPGSCLFDVLEEARIMGIRMLHDVVRVYSNERRLVLQGHLCGNPNHIRAQNDISTVSQQRQIGHFCAIRDGASSILLESQRNIDLALGSLSIKHGKRMAQIDVLKSTILSLLHIPDPCPLSNKTRPIESQGTVKRPLGSLGIKVDLTYGTPGCEECRRAKKKRFIDERSSSIHGLSNQSDDEDTWWMRKGPKSQESVKVELSLKSTKPASRGRRKTQSLAQLQATRIESSQGTSSSHICDNKVNCPHHKAAVGGEPPNDVDQLNTVHLSDITRTLKQLRSLEKRFISIWLAKTFKQLIKGNEMASSKKDHPTGAFSAQHEERYNMQWRLGEDELSIILYVLDVSSDLVSAVKLLIWLLPKILGGPSLTMHAGRNIMSLGKHKENQFCSVREAFMLSSLQRYENVLVATDLLPEVLTAAMNRAVTMMASNTRSSSSMTLAYARNLLKKYRDVGSVAKWEKSFRTTCDQRLLAELDAGWSVDGDSGFSPGGPGGTEDYDEYLRQKITSRLPRTGPVMKELLQRHIDEVIPGRERELFTSATTKNPEKWNDGNQAAQEIVLGLLECIRQNGGTTQEMDHTLVVSAVSAIVGSIGPAVAKLTDFAASNNCQSFSSTASLLSCARHILHIHINSLRLLKEALGERLSRTFDVALAAEASTSISGAFPHVKAPRTQFQLSPEIHDINPKHSNEVLGNSVKAFIGRATKAAAAVSALVVGVIVNGVVSLERIIAVFKIKEGLDVLQFIRSSRFNSNGISRSFGTCKLDHCIEVYVHWFRLLVGNCRTVFDGLVTEILGESYTLALLRMQRMLPLSLVFPPAYSIFAMVLWRPYILNSNIATCEDVQLYHCLSLAIGDTIKHRPFRDICLRNTGILYDLLASDVGDSEFAAMLELHSLDKQMKTMAFVPLRARLFLNAIIDSKMPPFTLMKEDGSWVSRPSEMRTYVDNETKLLDQLVHILDTLQPAKFHWQWVELRLLLNEQVLIEKIETQNMSLVEAIRSLSRNTENYALSENEKTFIEIVLTRLLVRPDAAPLYSEVVNLLGKSLEESLFLNAKWFLGGNDVLLGRKSIRQRLLNVAHSRTLLIKGQFWKPWGWLPTTNEIPSIRGDRRKLEIPSIEEGEVVDDSMDINQPGKMNSQVLDPEGLSFCKQYKTERAFAELIFPCMDRSSSESQGNFAGDLIKQLSSIEQHMSMLTRGGSKQPGGVSSGVEGSSNKGNSRKGIKGGSPGLGRRSTGVSDPSPPSAIALKASMWLRLQFLLRLLPIIYADRAMRHTLASVVLRLLGFRLVYEDADMPVRATQKIPKRDEKSPVNASVDSSLDLSGDSLFDKFLCVLHGLLSNCKPSWLKPRLGSKSTVKSPRDFSVFDHEVSESLQAELDRMELPATIRTRIQAAMPLLAPSIPFSVSSHPPTLSSLMLSPLQPSTSTPGFHQGSSNLNQRSSTPSTRPPTNMPGKSKTSLSPDAEMEIDAWMLLEDGTASALSSSSGTGGVITDHANLKACSWLRGAVRVRRTDLTYVGTTDDDS